MFDLATPPLLGLFGAGYALHLLWERWHIRRARSSFARWRTSYPMPTELNDLMNDPEHLMFLIQQARASFAKPSPPPRETGER